MALLGSSGEATQAGSAAGHLFLIDARHRTERKVLLAWLRGSAGGFGDAQAITLNLADEGRSLDLAALAQRLASLPDSTQIVPVRLTWLIPKFSQHRPLRLRDLLFGDPREPGRLRARFILWRDRGRAQCLRGEPATLAQLRARFASEVAASDGEAATALAGFVARQAALTLEAQERGVRGARYKVPRFVADSIAASPAFRASLAEIAAETGTSPAALMPEARRYMKELISTPSPLWLDLRARLERLMMTLGYERGFDFDPAELERLRQLIRTKPTVLLFTHKTYLDGVTPNALFYDNDMTMLHSFGGINLDMKLIGTLFRRSGLIFIRRSFQDIPVYKAVLRRYIGYLLEKRFPMSWALEGTRSRLGKLMPPRYGILKYVTDAANAAGIDDLHIVPFVTSFDLIRDVEEYAAEQMGRAKKAESLSWFIGYLRSLREPMGRVRIDLGEPVIVRRSAAGETSLELARIAFDASVSANRATPLTFTAVLCMVLLGSAPRAVTAPELTQIVGWLAEWARARGIRMAEGLDPLDLETLRRKADTLVNSGLVRREEAGRERVYFIDPAKHAMASYYRNTVVHHFLAKAFIELALFKCQERAAGDATAAFWDEILRLRDLLKFEFFYPPKDEYRRELEAELERTDRQWQAHLAGGPAGLATLIARFQPLLGHAAVLPFVEAYVILFEQLVRLKLGEMPDIKACVEQGLVEGRQAYLLRRISSQASLGKILFENGYQLAENLGLTVETTAAVTAKRRALLAELRALAHRMERMRIDVVARAEQAQDAKDLS